LLFKQCAATQLSSIFGKYEPNVICSAGQLAHHILRHNFELICSTLSTLCTVFLCLIFRAFIFYVSFQLSGEYSWIYRHTYSGGPGDKWGFELPPLSVRGFSASQMSISK